MLTTRERMPWSGHMAVHALPEVYREIREAGTTLVFVNTRAQAEIVFQELWRLNDDNLPIALHHGSLAHRAAAQGRGGDGGGKAARGRRHVLARSRHRLGRRRPGGAGRRAEGGEPADPAHRPVRPPAGHAEPRAAGARQPVRGAGMPRRARRDPRQRRWTATRRSPAGSTCWRSTSWRWPVPRRSIPTTCSARCGRRRPTPSLSRGDFDAVVAFVDHGGYALRSLRAVAPARTAAGRTLQGRLAGGGAPAADEHRHHRRGDDAEGADQARPPSRRGRGVFRARPGNRRHFPLFRPAACGSRASAT